MNKNLEKKIGRIQKKGIIYSCVIDDNESEFVETLGVG